MYLSFCISLPLSLTHSLHTHTTNRILIERALVHYDLGQYSEFLHTSLPTVRVTLSVAMNLERAREKERQQQKEREEEKEKSRERKEEREEPIMSITDSSHMRVSLMQFKSTKRKYVRRKRGVGRKERPLSSGYS